MSKPRENKAKTAAPRYSRTLKRLPLTVVQDTREQWTPDFGEGVTVQRAHLAFGDYTVAGLTDRLCIEMKWSADDLVTCCTFDRERFTTMLQGMTKYPMRALIVAASEAEIWTHKYESQCLPKTVFASLWAFQQDFRLPIVFAHGKHEAARVLLWHARRAQRKAAKEGKAA